MPRKKKDVKLFTLDTETIGLGGAIRRIAIYDGKEVKYGYTFKDIEPFLIEESKNYSVHIYIHNLDFDLRKLDGIFRSGNVKWNKCLNINRKYATLECQYYTLHDSFQLLPMSLKKASESFNLKHGKLDLWEEVQKLYPGEYKDTVDFLARCHVDNELYLKYLGYDVISLYELILKLCEVSTIPLDKLIKCPTTASMSKYIFKNGYKGIPFKDEKYSYTDYQYLIKNKYWLSDKEFKKSGLSWQELEYKIREAYYGGRTEVFTPYLSNGGFYYDVNSLYPYVCKNNPYPVGVPEFINNENRIKYIWRKWCYKHYGLGFLKCKIYVPEQDIPPLPSRVDKLCFLTGYIEGTWTFNEIEYAVKECKCEILEFQEMIYFKETFYIYKQYIDIFNTLKEEATKNGDMALREFCKLMNNTAYGWTGMKRLQISLDDISKKEKYIEKDTFINEDKELGFIQYSAKARSETIQVQIASYVTSYARLVLLKALKEQAKKGKVYYCDTDSIVCEKPMESEFVDEVKLGFWAVENVVEKGIFLFPKVYSFINKEDETIKKFKGITRGKQTELKFEFYEKLYNKLCNGETEKIEIEKDVERLRSLITTQKNRLNPNEVILTHKEISLTNMQKRNINYKYNYSTAWYIDSYEAFNNFTFNINYNERGDFFEKRRTN